MLLVPGICNWTPSSRATATTLIVALLAGGYLYYHKYLKKPADLSASEDELPEDQEKIETPALDCV